MPSCPARPDRTARALHLPVGVALLALLAAAFSLVAVAATSSDAVAQDQPQVVPEPVEESELEGRPAFPFTMTDTTGETVDQRLVASAPYAIAFVRSDCRWSRALVQDAVAALADRDDMRLIVMVLDPRNVAQDRPTPLMKAKELHRTLVAGNAAAGRVTVGLPTQEVVNSYGSLVYGERNQAIRDVPILLAIDENGTIRAGRIGSASGDRLTGALDAARSDNR